MYVLPLTEIEYDKKTMKIGVIYEVPDSVAKKWINKRLVKQVNGVKTVRAKDTTTIKVRDEED